MARRRFQREQNDSPEPQPEDVQAFVADIPEVTEAVVEVAPVIVPEVIAPVVVTPTVSSLRADYDRLVKLVPTLKAGTPEFKQAMEAKRAAFGAWHKAANG